MSAPDFRDLVIEDLADENAGLRARLESAEDSCETYRAIAQVTLASNAELTTRVRQLTDRCHTQQRQLARLLDVCDHEHEEVA